ncbi:carotenoid biosynthesis protein [Hymenobacter sp. H14-R3]|uniref:carotenoid biosynthesis protein n=1 Tax=Hymenobacter sp. H14-R3 TaxID=3046308 RepID=UPI0024BA2D91|nr:carotenoid biosynthesis protein [Hymenobacter sp. H14-R3]MDJ0367352.1 carotenoid biosynthesis protein [Hymenobacter sp. H14-R3]
MSPAASTLRLRIAQGVIVLFHLTGFVGLAFSEDKSFYLTYTPLTLVLTLGLLAAFQPGRNLVFWLFVAQVFLLGMVAEIVGTNTGLLFGHYTYGATLGPKYMGTPWLIGLNWVMVTYLAGMLMTYVRVPALVRVLLGAVLMVGLDLCMEPVAGRYDFWHWTGELVPLRNFRDWFLLALLTQALFVRSPFPKRNALAPLVYLVQLLFFFGLTMLAP